MFYPGEQCAFPVVVLDLNDVIHDEPGPDVKVPGSRYSYHDLPWTLSPVVNTFQDQSDQLEAEECDDENHLVFLKLIYVGVEGIAQEDTVLHDDDEVEEELSDQSGDVLEGFWPGQEQRIHPEKYN